MKFTALPDVARALVPAAPALVPAHSGRFEARLDTSVEPAGTSARATTCLAALLILFSSAAFAAPPEDCHLLRKHGKKAEASACYEKMAVSRDLYLRAEGLWGLGDHKNAHEAFKALVDNKQSPSKDPKHYTRWGDLFLDKSQPPDAAQLYTQALELNPKYAPAMLGLARAGAVSYNPKAIQMANEALETDPKMYEALELLAGLALEDSDQKRAIEKADAALAISPEAFDALAVRATIEILNDKPGTEWLDKIWKVNPTYGQAHAIIAHHLVLNRRYDEGIANYRKAIELDPQDWAARSQLGINLMRMGGDEEARKHLEMCYENGFKDEATVNTLRLLDSYANFVTVKSDNTILRLHKKEAEVLKDYFQDELKRAIATYEKKYKIKLPRAVQLEVYPDHEDFAVRTMGMPGLGALGVTFGDVVAMDSPSGRTPGSFHWDSTLWHELSHVFVLTATKHRVPRWFTEGVAVHEETAAAPDWGDRVTPDMLMAIKDKKLLPVENLDRGFIRPSYPNQVIISYFQGGRMIDYIVQKWGFDKVLSMMYAFAARKTTPEVIEQELKMKPEEFDKQFLAWLEADLGKAAEGFAEWQKRLHAVRIASGEGEHDKVIKEGEALIALYPDYTDAANPYEFVEKAYLAKGDKAGAMRVLEAYAKIGGRNPEVLKRTAAMQEAAGKKKEAIATLEKVNWIYPVNNEPMHRKLGDLLAEQANWTGALREYRAVVASKPIDAASAHYNLARAYAALNRDTESEEQLMLSLEAAPTYRPAQKLLLELTAKKTKEKK